MTAATVSRLGQINGAGDVDAMFLKVYSGEIIATYDNINVMQDKHRTRNISSGKSAQFPVIGDASAAYHTPGAEIVGTAIPHAEKVIVIDDVLLSDVFIANIDEAKAHYDVRGVYSKKQGTKLSNTYDANVQQVICLAARAAATITGGDGGTVLTNAAYATTGATIAAGVFDSAQALDEHNAPEDDRYCNLRPAQYYLVAQTTNVINRDWGGSGVYADGTVLKVAGISFVKTNQLPSTNVTTGPAAYQGNFATLQGLVYHKDAVGTVKLMDLGVESEYDMRRQGHLMIAKYAVGHGILQPENAIELKSA